MARNAVVSPVLTCWKDIAQYFGKGVRTVQRWEQELGLPVRRPNGIDHKRPVAASPTELDLWLKARWGARNGEKTLNVPISAEDALPRVAPPVSEMIRTSRELRVAQKVLVAQTSMAVEMLKHNCAELKEHLKAPAD